MSIDLYVAVAQQLPPLGLPPEWEQAPALTLGLGKFNARQKTTQMTFGEDLNYEGGWEQITWKPREGIWITLGALQTAVNERSAAVDSYMVGGHGGVTFAVGRHNLQFSAANYAWGNPD